MGKKWGKTFRKYVAISSEKNQIRTGTLRLGIRCLSLSSLNIGVMDPILVLNFEPIEIYYRMKREAASLIPRC